MQFLKKHYEKLVLSVVLLVLAVAAGLMPLKVGSENRAMEEKLAQLTKAPAKPLKPADISTNELALARLKTNVDIELNGAHNLFNPVKWQKKPDGGLIKGSEVGLRSVEVAKITPLNMVITLEDVSGDTNSFRYQISVFNETDKPPRKITRIVPNVPGSKGGNLFVLKEVHGPPEAPTNIVLTLQNNEKSLIALSKEKPFVQVAGYSADLKSEMFNLNRKNLRVKDRLALGEETYNIVAIGHEEVVLSAQSNAKQTTLRYSAPPVK